jgi:hypothetical protein
MQSIQTKDDIQRLIDSANSDTPAIMYVKFSRLATGGTALYFRTQFITYEDERISKSVELCNRASTILRDGNLHSLNEIQHSLAELKEFITTASNLEIISSTGDYLSEFNRDCFRYIDTSDTIEVTAPNCLLRNSLHISCSALLKLSFNVAAYLNEIYNRLINIYTRENTFTELTVQLINIFGILYNPAFEIIDHLLKQGDSCCKTNANETISEMVGNLAIQNGVLETQILRLATFPSTNSVDIRDIHVILEQVYDVCKEYYLLPLPLIIRYIVPLHARRIEYEQRAAQERPEPSETLALTYDHDRA